MFGKFFGGSKPPRGRQGSNGDGNGSDGPPPGDAPRVTSAAQFPWADDPAYAAINFALGDLINNLPRRLTIDGRIHAETFVAASGAVAGYAAQRALFTRLSETPGRLDAEIKIATAKNGDRFFFGDALNEALLGRSQADAGERLWPLAAGAAVTAGLKLEDLPSVDPFFAHVARTIGSAEEGDSSIAGRRLQAPAKELLKAVWPLALMCFNSQLSGKVLQPPVVVPPRWRPVIAARAAAASIGKVAGVLPPREALTILMETAIYASKLHPSAVEPAQPT